MKKVLSVKGDRELSPFFKFFKFYNDFIDSVRFKSGKSCALMLLFLLLVGGCGNEVSKEGKKEAAASLQLIPADFIINGVDWTDVGQLPLHSPARINANAVGNLIVVNKSSRCTAFLITDSIIMTNHHCVSNSYEARGAFIEFKLEKGIPQDNRARYLCEDFIDASSLYDVALLRCAQTPGRRFGHVYFDSSTVEVGGPIYVIHQNCNHEVDGYCTPHKKYSPGKVTKAAEQWSPMLVYDADTLQGSSGGPVFSRRGHGMVALNNVGLYHTANGVMVGDANAGVPANMLVDFIQRNHPEIHIQLAKDFPQGPQGPNPDDQYPNPNPDPKPTPIPDPIPVPIPHPPHRPHRPHPIPGDMRVDSEIEPNDTLASATEIQLPYQKIAEIHDLHDHDYFRFHLNTNGRLSALIKFNHQRGDLDFKLINLQTRKVLVKKEGNENVEFLTKELPAGDYALHVYGFGGADGIYTFEIKFNPDRGGDGDGGGNGNGDGDGSGNGGGGLGGDGYTLYETSNQHSTIASAQAIYAPAMPIYMRGNVMLNREKDLYRLDIRRGGRVQLVLRPLVGAGDLDLYVLDQWGQVVKKSVLKNTQVESVPFEYLPAGRYYILIKGYLRATGSYVFSLH